LTAINNQMKYLFNIIAVFLVFLVVLGAIKFKDSDTYYGWRNKVLEFFQDSADFIKDRKENIALESSPKRKAPVTFIEQEEILKAYVPDVFGNFSQKQWVSFWNLIYKPVATSKSFFAKKRFRTQEEVERILINSYPDPFSYFQVTHWHDFWDIAGVRWKDE